MNCMSENGSATDMLELWRSGDEAAADIVVPDALTELPDFDQRTVDGFPMPLQVPRASREVRRAMCNRAP